MNERLNWMFPSLFLGRMFSTDVRISAWFGLIPFILCPRYGLELGLAVTLLFVVTALLHDFSHVIAARWTGGYAEEIHLTPLGGLVPTRSGQGAIGAMLTAAAGPGFNLLACLALFPGWYAPKTLWNSLNPFVLPVSEFHEGELLRDLLLILFTVNWVVLLLNLLPVMPLDGGLILRAFLSLRIHPEIVHRTALQVGLGVSVLLLISGAITDISQVVLIGTVVLVINIVQYMQEESGEYLDDSGYAFDFTAGYDSLDTPNPTTTRQANQGLLQRWRERRRIRREQQERIRRLEAEQQLDSLLAKVHESGFQSLSEQEQATLRNCSEFLRDRQKSEE